MRIDITSALGDNVRSLQGNESKNIANSITIGEDSADDFFSTTDRSPCVRHNLQRLFDQGRLTNTGDFALLTIDADLNQDTSASNPPHSVCFDPSEIVKLAIEGDCNAVASTASVLSRVAHQYACKIPFIVKLDNNESSVDNDQFFLRNIKKAFELGAIGVSATVDFASFDTRRQIEEVRKAFTLSHQLGMITVLSACLQNGAPEKVLSDAPKIEWVRYHTAKYYMGRVGMVNSGGISGAEDIQQVVKAAVINKHVGGNGHISGFRDSPESLRHGRELLDAIMHVYLCNDITLV